jgi:hypothetical protein
LDDWLVEDEIIGRVEHERGHLDLCGVDIRELNGLAEIEKMIGVGEGGACYCCLIKECINLEFIRERLCGIPPFLRRCCTEGLARPFPAISLQSYDLLSAALRPSSGGSLP